MVTCCVLRADCSATRHDVHRAEVPKHRHVLQFALSTVFGHVKISQSEAVFRNHCFAERFGPQIRHVLLSLVSAQSQPLGPDLILHPQVCHIKVLQPTPCVWRMCTVAFLVSVANTGFIS